MNVVVTLHLPVCLYSAAGKKVNRQDFYTRQIVARTRCTVGRKNQNSEPASKTVSFLDNELREGVFRTFGFLKPKRLFSRIKLVMKNDLAPRRGCWGLVLKCYESRTRQHKMLNVNILRPFKHYFPKDIMIFG
jgi:hypothetical protein